MKTMPKVSVICWAYNQEKYIAQTLDSFLMQKTNFPFEVVIHDDASTDRTKDIIREYEARHPEVIKPIYQKVNQFSKETGGFIKQTFKAARGKYIALCEGDDFWTDENKLQKQVDFLEKHPDYSICFHSVRIFMEGDKYQETISPKDTTGFTLDRLLHGNFIHTNTVMYRKTPDYENLMTEVMPVDWYLHAYHAQFGKIGFINSVMSAYRRHPDGIWWGVYQDSGSVWRDYGVRHFKALVEVYNLYSHKPKYKKIMQGSLSWAIEETAKQGPVYLEKLMIYIYQNSPIQTVTSDIVCDLILTKAKLEDRIKEMEVSSPQLDQTVVKSPLLNRVIRKATKKIKRKA